MRQGSRSGGARDDWVVRVPASSANLGSAFDAVAVALDLHLEVTACTPDDEAAPETHPAVRAFRQSGELEGHFDNVAASLFGGIVAVAGGHAVRIPLPRDLAVVVWTPDRETPTPSARRLLPEHVSFEDAAFNIGRTALLVAALAAGDVGALRTATEDRLHQGRRLARAHDTRVAIDAALAAGAFAAWLSGSGPSAAALADPACAEEIAAAMPGDGRTRVLAIADVGATVTTRDGS